MESSPYPGLRYFGEEDSGRFFGREGVREKVNQAIGTAHGQSRTRLDVYSTLEPENLADFKKARIASEDKRYEGKGCLNAVANVEEILAPKFLGISLLPPAKPAEVAAPAAAEGTGETAAPPAEAPKPEPTLSIDERAKLARMQGDLVWLVREGYVTEFIDGRLFAPPPMVEARKQEIESEEHDPENFPEAPPARR